MRKILLSLVVLAWVAPVTVWATEQCFPEVTCRHTVPPATQTVASGDTITANACGSVKRVSADGSVTTDTTNTFDAPESGNAGCVMVVCNVGSNTITLDDNTNFNAGGDVSLTADSCIIVAQRTDQWVRAAAVVNN